MHGGEHGDNVSTLSPTTVRGEQVEEIPWGNAGVKGAQVSEAPDPSVFDKLEDGVPVPHLTGLDDRLGGKSGGSFSFHILSESVGGIIFDARVVRLEGANHGVEAYGRVKRGLVGRIGEDESRRSACIGAEGDGVNDGDDGLAKADHIVICQRANDGGAYLPSCVEQGDDV